MSSAGAGGGVALSVEVIAACSVGTGKVIVMHYAAGH
jgi:hypothetical protein